MKRNNSKKAKPIIEALSLDEAHQLLQELCSRQTDLDLQNQELKLELEALRSQNKKGSPPKQARFFHHAGQEQTENNLSPDRGLLRSIIDSVGDLIYVKDRNGVYRECNKASERFVGLRETESIGKTDFDFFDHDLAKAIQEADRQILISGREHCTEEWVPSPSGGRVLLETKRAPFYGPDGEEAGIVGISRDITAHKQAENALKKANRELDAFARTVAHDLRTPLTPILGHAEFLRAKYQGQLDERALESLDEIISSGEEMLQLMKDLLALAVAGHVDRPAVPLDATEVAQAVVRRLATQLSLAGVSVNVGDLPTVRVPKTLLVQVFDNLILNALKYGSKTGDVIEVWGDRSEERVSLYVRDQGPGIPASEREHIFEVFFRGTTEQDKPGTGIGLATVQKIAGLFDGRARVDETPGGGSTFCIDLVDIPVSAP